MITSIIITGQINGNTVIFKSINTDNAKVNSLPFNNGKEIIFKSKALAKKALWDAYCSLRKDKEDAAASMLSYSKYGTLSYDASRAYIN